VLVQHQKSLFSGYGIPEFSFMTDKLTVTPGVYRHYKGGMYDVIGVARHSETDESLVVYRPQYGEKHLWVRPLAMFTETVTVDGLPQRRFSPENPSSN
jgi:hypothetical protein